MHLGSQQIAPACVQSNWLGLGIGSGCCVVEPMLTELVKTTTTTTTKKSCVWVVTHKINLPKELKVTPLTGGGQKKLGYKKSCVG